MNVSIVTCVFVLDNQKSSNIKKNDLKSLKVLVNKKSGNLIINKYDGKSNLRDITLDSISDILGSNKFYLEQVCAFGESKYYDTKSMDVIYMALTNIENTNKLSDDYELVPFKNLSNNMVVLGEQIYDYSKTTKKSNGYIETSYDIDVEDINKQREVSEVLKVYNHLKNRISNLLILSKLMPSRFTLEDVKIVYEMIKNIQVDKSNFRKKLMKYCVKTEDKIENKGYRPTQLYKFPSLSNDIWI